MRYEPAIDVDGITALDMHVHIEIDDEDRIALQTHLMDAVADAYRARKIAAVVFTVDAATALGHPTDSRPSTRCPPSRWACCSTPTMRTSRRSIPPLRSARQ